MREWKDYIRNKLEEDKKHIEKIEKSSEKIDTGQYFFRVSIFKPYSDWDWYSDISIDGEIGEELEPVMKRAIEEYKRVNEAKYVGGREWQLKEFKDVYDVELCFIAGIKRKIPFDFYKKIHMKYGTQQ